MRRKDKRNLLKGLFIAVVVMAVGILWAANYTLPVDESLVVTSPKWIESLHGFFLDIYTAISTDYEVILIITAVVVAGFYFLVYKPKTSRR